MVDAYHPRDDGSGEWPPRARADMVEPGTTTLPVSHLPADEADGGSVLSAEWALWGKEEQQTALHVLRCSKGALDDDDFREIFTRYATGVKEQLPQYTVCWIPADGRRPAYLAVAIHELAGDPENADGRSRNVAGRVVEYVRLFCFEYARVAEDRVSYTRLVDAVQGELLEVGRSELIRVRLPPPGGALAPRGQRHELAMQAAWQLLTLRPLCVLDADSSSARDRLMFIDEVMSLLPFGLRAALSATTWASPTAQDLKVRLFFSTARRDSATRTNYLSWVRPDWRARPGDHDRSAEFYRSWLQQASRAALATLPVLKKPKKFTKEDIASLLPDVVDTPPEQSARDLATALRAGDSIAVNRALEPLRRCLIRGVQADERAVYRSLAKRYRLFEHSVRLNRQTRQDTYNTLLALAFNESLTYSDYCDIEYAAAGQFDTVLATTLLHSGIDTMAYIVVAKAWASCSDDIIMNDLMARGTRPGWLLELLEERIGKINENHRGILDAFAVNYLMSYAADPEAVLVGRNYLSSFYGRAYPAEAPGGLEKQRVRLNDVLRSVCGDRQLNGKQIVEIFAQPYLDLDGPIEHAVLELAPQNLKPLVTREARCARLVQAGRPDQAELLRAQTSPARTLRLPRPDLRRRQKPGRRARPPEQEPVSQHPDMRYSFAAIPAKNVFLVLGFVMLFALVLWVVFALWLKASV